MLTFASEKLSVTLVSTGLILAPQVLEVCSKWSR